MERCYAGRSSPVVIAPSEVFLRWEISREAMRSVSGNDDDCDDNECRDQRKSAIKSFRSGLCDIVERRHDLGWWLQFANEPANVSGFHWI